MRLPAVIPAFATAVVVGALAAPGCGYRHGVSSSSASVRTKPAGATCSLGTSLGPSLRLIRPRAATFYSVDALNPDVVLFHGRYLMYFSGNDRRTPAGSWHTGLATRVSPTGPFRVDPAFSGNYLNGGTAVWHGCLWHTVELNPDNRGELASSADGIHWRHESYVPTFHALGDVNTGADFFLAPAGDRLDLHMLIVPRIDRLGRSLAVVSYTRGRWSTPRVTLDLRLFRSIPWASVDLGEPASFQDRGGRYLLFVGLSRDGTRSIGLARRAQSGSWVLCGSSPAIPGDSPAGTASAIDPTPLIRGDRLFIYYGATRTKGLAGDLGGSIAVCSYRLS